MTDLTIPKRKYVRSGKYSKSSHAKMHGEHGAPVVLPKLTAINKNGALNLTTEIQLKLIKNAEEKIQKCNEDLAALEPSWKEKFDFLIEAREDFKTVDDRKVALEKEIEDQGEIIRGFSEYLGLKKKKPITANTLEQEKAEKTKRKKLGPRIEWLQELATELKKADRFLDFDAVYNRITMNKEWVKSKQRPDSWFGSQKGAVRANTLAHCALFHEKKNRKASFTQVIVEHNGKIGLADWVDPTTGEIKNRKHLIGLAPASANGNH